MIHYVLGLALTVDKTCVLLHEHPDWPEGSRGWNGFGGKIEESRDMTISIREAEAATVLKNMHREWLEETNLPSQEWDYFLKFTDDKVYTVHVLRCVLPYTFSGKHLRSNTMLFSIATIGYQSPGTGCRTFADHLTWLTRMAQELPSDPWVNEIRIR